MRLITRIDLPEHAGRGGFDHAAVQQSAGRLFVAHTSNDAVDVIDCAEDRYVGSIPGLKGVAGALVSDELGLIFTSNRAEDTVGIIDPAYYDRVVKVGVGVRPNGLSLDAERGYLLAANVGDPAQPASHTVSIVDVERRTMIGSIPMPGRTRWTIYDEGTDSFYVNIAEPSQIAVIGAERPSEVASFIDIPAGGPHGLDIDSSTGRLFCACDSGKLFALEAATGRVLQSAELSGAPDVIFFNAVRRHLYIAIGEPGVLDVFDTDSMRRIETIATARGAHTIGFDATRNKIYVFEPGSHSAAVYQDTAPSQ